MNDIQAMFNMMHQFPLPNISMPNIQLHQFNQMPGGMAIHIIDLTRPININNNRRVQSNTSHINTSRSNISHVKIEELSDKNDQQKPLLLEKIYE